MRLHVISLVARACRAGRRGSEPLLAVETFYALIRELNKYVS